MLLAVGAPLALRVADRSRPHSDLKSIVTELSIVEALRHCPYLKVTVLRQRLGLALDVEVHPSVSIDCRCVRQEGHVC